MQVIRKGLNGLFDGVLLKGENGKDFVFFTWF